MTEQIIEAEQYLQKMTLNEFCHGKLPLPESLKNKLVKVDWFHLLHPTPDIKFRNGKWYAERFKGFHLDYMGILEKAGEISYTNLQKNPSGCYKADVKVAGILKEINKTMFPKNWRLVDLIENIRKACNKPTSLRLDHQTNTLMLEGDFSNFIKGRIFIDSNGTITTTYPLSANLRK